MSEPRRVDVRLDTRARGTVAYLTHRQPRQAQYARPRADGRIHRRASMRLAARADLRALVLTGAGGKAFIGGASIPEMAALDRDTRRAISSRWCTGCCDASAAICRCR